MSTLTEPTARAPLLLDRPRQRTLEQSGATTTKALLVCGILSSVAYVSGNVFGAMVWDSYNSVSQTVSELFAIDAPSRPIFVAHLIAYSLLTIAFGFGVWRSAAGKRSLRIVGGLFIAYGIVCLSGPLTPMHQREALVAGQGSFTDTVHILMTIVDVVFIVLMIGFGSTAFGKRFRIYSIATIVVLLAFGALTAMDAPALEKGLPTPWAGVTERINIGAFLLWVVVLAVALLRGRGELDSQTR